mmetsp:Transcript_24314/g.43130  ORF Transcript_24314/g.43130 Transcript_24314/m.43130 type:complete len:460 (+) Transcript_24314:73-1452(+)|eukprot:CAMPEP_0197518000 /NCGR_PEP_ID=MMETSP1318-20131121/3089_1 /TAXON_ID=552666 /ORGANISM="Partenskyella glossopodia, Strain RCC365" /LENGTH=459 /DNA_ID=CAMNT_0043067995 /DNA_START=23 /DNA_END=1402 /DNA_ORIENTATION=+
MADPIEYTAAAPVESTTPADAPANETGGMVDVAVEGSAGPTDAKAEEKKKETVDLGRPEAKVTVAATKKQIESKGLSGFYMCLDSLESDSVVSKGHHVVDVTVTEPKAVRTLTSSYTTYAVTIQPAIEEVKFVRRRYSDFVWLRKWLGNAFPGLFVPPLPPKSLFGKMKVDFIEDRRRGLQNFMKRLISRQPFIIHSQPFQLFVSKHANTFDKTKRDIEKTIGAQTEKDTASLLNSLFPDLAGFAMPHDAKDRVVKLKDYLVNASKQVGILLESAEKISGKWSEIVTHSSDVTDALTALGKVENGYAQLPTPPRMEVAGKFESWAGVIQDKPAQWSDIVVEIFKQEKLDIEAMLESIKKWDGINSQQVKATAKLAKYDKQVEGGKPLTAKQEVQKKADKEHLDAVNALHQIVTKVLFESELVHYWDNKTAKFNSQVHSFFQKQLAISSKLAGVWATESE